MNIEGYLNAAQVADLLGIQKRSVYNFAQRLVGFPQPERIGRTVLWRESEIKAWRKAHPTRKN